jgi:hypothetical protein
MDWMKVAETVYETIGPRHPTASLVSVAVIGAALFGGAWWFLGKQYEKQHQQSVASSSPPRPPPTATPSVLPNTVIPESGTPPKSAPHKHLAHKPNPQSQSPSIQQHSEGPNSPNTAVIGNNNHVTVNPDPTIPVITYLYDGDQRISRPGFITDNPGNPAARIFERIRAAHISHDWPLLLSICDEAINETPEWLTPRLYKAEAYANLGRLDEAVAILKEVKDKAAGNQDYDRLTKEADELLQKLHNAGH